MIDIKGFEGLYAVTADGQVWSYLTKQFMSQYDNGQGYLYVNLYKDGKHNRKRINKLVALAYLGEPPADGRKYVADHIDGNRKNNHKDNIQWITQSENVKKGNIHFSRPHRPVRCVETGEVFKNQTEAGRAIGKHKYGINNVLKGKQNTCGGYHWEYADESSQSST